MRYPVDLIVIDAYALNALGQVGPVSRYDQVEPSVQVLYILTAVLEEPLFVPQTQA